MCVYCSTKHLLSAKNINLYNIIMMTPKTEIHNIKLGNFYIENNLCKNCCGVKFSHFHTICKISFNH